MTPNGKNAVLCLTREGLESIIARLPDSGLQDLIQANILPADLAGGRSAGAGMAARYPAGNNAARASAPASGAAMPAQAGPGARRISPLRASPSGASAGGRSGAGPARAVVNSIARIAQTSRHSTCHRDAGSGRNYCIFDGRLAGRRFRILVQPEGDARYRIVSIRSNDGSSGPKREMKDK